MKYISYVNDLDWAHHSSPPKTFYTYLTLSAGHVGRFTGFQIAKGSDSHYFDIEPLSLLGSPQSIASNFLYKPN